MCATVRVVCISRRLAYFNTNTFYGVLLLQLTDFNDNSDVFIEHPRSLFEPWA